MLEALKPENYDKVVTASRIISGYDEITKCFKSVSLALHLRTILLATCSATKKLFYRKDCFFTNSPNSIERECILSGAYTWMW